MSKRKVEPIFAPSSVINDDLKDVRASGNACLNLYTLTRMLDFYQEPPPVADTNAAENELDLCSKALFSLAKNHMVGPFTVASKPNEKTVSGVFAAQLQHLLSRFMFQDQKHVPDILVATQQKLKSGGIDATVYKHMGEAGLHPRVLFEFAVEDSNKEPQLFSYVNNASTVIGDDIQLLMTGCVVTLFRDRPLDSKLQVFAYVKIRPPPAEDNNGEGARIAAIPIYNGIWTAVTVKRLLRMVRNLLSLPMSHFDMPVGDLLPYERTRENVLIDGTVVYKIYDYRGTAGEGDRHPDGNIEFLGAGVTVQDDSGLCVIRYPLVEGDHTAQLAVDFVGVLLHLRDVHAAGKLHMDIKLGNVIFNHSNVAASRLIDFDYCGRAGIVSYPTRYNLNITDGERHNDAVAGNKGIKSHDWFAMMSVMKLFKPSNGALASQWEEWSTRVGLGQLAEVATELGERGNGFELEMEEGVQVGDATGSPPQLKSGHKRARGNAPQEEAGVIL